MNLIVLEPADFISEHRVRLTGRRLEHLRGVLKAVPGKSCKAGLLGGAVGTAVVERLDGEAAELAVTLDDRPPAKLPLTVAMALPRPKTLRKVLHAAVTLGVSKLYFFGSFKVEKSYWDSPFLNPDFLRGEQLLALEQCGDTHFMPIELRRFFKPFVEDELAPLAAGGRLLAAHPEAAAPCPAGVSAPVTLVLGPEGGFTAYETELLGANGAELVNIGRRILRTEVALPTLIGRLFA